MNRGDRDSLKTQISELIGDILTQFIDEDDLTGKLLEEAVLEALQENASYFSARAKVTGDLLESYLALRLNGQKEDGADCSSSCDI